MTILDLVRDLLSKYGQHWVPPTEITIRTLKYLETHHNDSEFLADKAVVFDVVVTLYLLVGNPDNDSNGSVQCSVECLMDCICEKSNIDKEEIFQWWENLPESVTD